MFEFPTPYTDMFYAEKKLFRPKPKPIVLHRMTCPCCGSKLVNLYFSASQDRYICKECLDVFLKERE